MADRPDDDIDGGASPDDSSDATTSVWDVNTGEGDASVWDAATAEPPSDSAIPLTNRRVLDDDAVTEEEREDAPSATSAIASAVNAMQALPLDALDAPQLPPTTTDDLIDDFDDIFGVLSETPDAAATPEPDPAAGQAASRQIEGTESPTPPAAPLNLSSFSAGAHTKKRKRRR
ncbi:MAG: hypothetical protein ACI9AD_001385 [Nitriliruptoraceae bacterium]